MFTNIVRFERNKCLPTLLGGYRQEKKTWQFAAIFAQDVFEGFDSRMETCAVAIDLEDAYNRVSLDILMDQLLNLAVNPFVVWWVGAVLMHRIIVLKYGNLVSAPTVISPGLPQGSSVSPVLFNVYTVHITSTQITGAGRTMSYADDILVYMQGRHREECVVELQKELDRQIGVEIREQWLILLRHS